MKKSEKYVLCVKLFLCLFKIGAFTFGGGYAMIALLEHELITKRAWLDKEDFLRVVAIAESTPGPIAINCATYVGYKTAGVLGSLAATLGVVLPSFVLLFIISLFFDAFISLTWVAYAFRGIQAAVIYLILMAGIKMLRALKKDAFDRILFGSVFVVMLLFSLFAVNFSSVFYILICGTAGVILSALRRIRKKEDEK